MRRLREVTRALHALIVVLPARRQRQLVGLVAIMFAAALAEIVSLGAVVPFLALLANTGNESTPVRMVREMASSVGIARGDLMLTLTIAFALLAVLAGVVRICLNVALARINFRMGHELGSEIYHNALHQSYQYHALHNSSEIIGGIVKVDTVIYVMLAVFIGISSGLMAVCIAAVILMVNPMVAAIAVLGFGGTYVLVSRLSHRQLLQNGRVINAANSTRLKAMQEGLGGIRDVLLDQTQGFHRRRFDAIDSSLRHAQESNQILGPTPRYVIEAIGMVVIAILGYHAASGPGGIGSALTTLGVLVLGGQRLLPLLQQAFQGWVMAVGHLDVLQNIATLAQHSNASRVPLAPRTAPLPFQRDIRLVDVGFRFESTAEPTLKRVNCVITRGARVGIIGPTGSGKSTLLNLLMGLLTPTHGRIEVDGTPITGSALAAWQHQIAHVPQTIFLSDATILENVALGVERESIDVDHAIAALRKAQLHDLMATLPLGIHTVVGEDGVRLSGGQRQRIGIARALYKRASVLVLDEATSALDNATETELMQAVDGLGRDVTLIMIAHRLSTLSGCDMLLRFEAGRLESIVGVEGVQRALASESREEAAINESE